MNEALDSSVSAGAAFDVPFGGAKGGVAVDASKLTPIEKEEIIRRWTRSLVHVLGHHRDIPAPDMGTDAKTMAWLMDEFHRLEGFQPACVTGKPVELFGAPGREEATGRGVAQITAATLEKNNVKVKGATVAIQGFGKVGYWAAIALENFGLKVVAVSDVHGGVKGFKSVKEVWDHYQAKGNINVPGTDKLTQDELLHLDVDVLIPAALADAITEKTAPGIKAKIIVEGANAPTTPGGDAIINDKGILVVPDILANSGGVIVSYFEWVQDFSSFFWSEDEINARLVKVMREAFARIWQIAQTYQVSLRTATFIVACTRILQAREQRGLYP